MIFNIILKFAVFLFVCISSINSACLDSVIEVMPPPLVTVSNPVIVLITTTGSAFNHAKVITRPTLATQTHSTASSCKPINGVSNEFGVRDKPTSTTQFSVSTSNLFSIVIYSSSSGISGMTFNFFYGSPQSYGDITTNGHNKISTTINLINKQIAAVDIQSGLWIKSIQFLTYDPYQNKYSWTQAIGGSGGSFNSINSLQFSKYAMNFQLTSLNGTSNKLNIRTLSFGYSYALCSSSVTPQTIPTTPIFQTYMSTTPFFGLNGDY